MAAAAPSVDPAAPVSTDIATAAGDKPPSPQSPEKPAEKVPFEVVVDNGKISTEEYVRSPTLMKKELVEEEEEIGVIEPAYYYDDGTIPVFTPTMDQFRSFKKFVDKINHYGMEAGIVKIIPPKEWVDSLPPLDEKVKAVKIKNPIEQHIQGTNGTFRQTNIQKSRTYNLPEWRHLCDGSEHQPPARRGERRKGREPRVKPVSRPTRVSRRKSIVAVKDEDDDEDDDDEYNPKGTPPTPRSPAPKTDRYGRQPRTVVESTPDPAETDHHGRQPRTRRTFKTAKQRIEDQASNDKAWFEDFDYRIKDNDSYTIERCHELEKAYWRTLVYNNPLYGADMPGSLFDDSVTSWNVAHLENLLDCLGKKLPGVNTAYLYLGMWKSTFAWHLEDMDLYSINYIHFGAPKQWYSISRKDKDKFERIMKSIYPNDAKKCTEFLRHKTFLVSPSLLAQHGIQVNRLVHHEQEFVITFPFGYHSGYNLGYNCAESVNFATETWLDYGREARICECIDDAVYLNVKEIERKLRGEPTPSEEEYESYESDEDDEDDEDDGEEGAVGDFPTPPESVEGKSVKVKVDRKRKREGGEKKKRRVKLRLRAPAREPCVLCPNDIPSEPLLPIESSEDQAHRLCALYTPETYFRDRDDGHKVIAGVPTISKARLDLKCFFCRSKKGSCFQCSALKCHRAYHATCAAAAGVLVNTVDLNVLGEDGNPRIQTNTDFRCRFHRPKRRKDIDSEALEEDQLIRAFAEARGKDDVIQMQYLQGDIFAGVVVENRKEEGTVLISTLPKGELLEVEWKWILALDPSQVNFAADASLSDVRGKNLPTRLPVPQEVFYGDYTWGELIVEEIPINKEQQKVNLKDWWYYLGEMSTDCIAKYTEDPKKRKYNEEGDFIKKKPPRPRPSKPVTIKYDLPYTGYPQQNGYNPYGPQYGQQYSQPSPYGYQGQPQYPQQQQLYASSGHHNAYNQGYRPQFQGPNPGQYAPAQSSPTVPGRPPITSGPTGPPVPAPAPAPSQFSAGYQRSPVTHHPYNNSYQQHQHRPSSDNYHPQQSHQPNRMSVTAVTQPTPVASPITPVWAPGQHQPPHALPPPQTNHGSPHATPNYRRPSSGTSSVHQLMNPSTPPPPPPQPQQQQPQHYQQYQQYQQHQHHQPQPGPMYQHSPYQHPPPPQPQYRPGPPALPPPQYPQQTLPPLVPQQQNLPAITDIKAALAKIAAARLTPLASSNPPPPVHPSHHQPPPPPPHLQQAPPPPSAPPQAQPLQDRVA